MSSINKKIDIQEAIFLNRDENSFTARLFEGILFPLFYKDNIEFEKFVKILNVANSRSREVILKKTNENIVSDIPLPNDLNFKQGMLFVECVDLFSACGKGSNDKTEFDVVIVAENSHAKSFVIVIEVKCYSNMQIEEIKRQQKLLTDLMKEYDFSDFFHIALISEDNLKNAKSVFKKDRALLNKDIFVISWQDLLVPYLIKNTTRFKKVCFNRIKKINKSTGIGGKTRVICNF